MKPAILFSFLLFLVLAAGAHAGSSAGLPAVTVTVSVFNDAGASVEDLDRARIRAQYVMERAGISLDWLNCGGPGRPRDPGCAALAYPKHLSVRLVAGRGHGSADVFGQSFQNAEGEGNYALVYYQLLRSSSAAKSVNPGDLLGLVVAHELGHLLLGLDSHAPAGVMCAVWGDLALRQATRGALFFSESESHRMVSRFITAANHQPQPAARRDGQ